jgi:hypothetical protein
LKSAASEARDSRSSLAVDSRKPPKKESDVCKPVGRSETLTERRSPAKLSMVLL